MQSIDNVLKLRKGLKPDDPNPDIFDILWAKKLSGAAKDYTVTGNPLSFLAKKAQTAKSTKVTLSPVQDLHGYDNPWPAGGGKNLFQTTATTKEQGSVTWTVNSDGSITASGTATAYSSIEAGEAIISGLSTITVSCNVSYTNNVVWDLIRLYDSNNQVLDTIYSGGNVASHTVDLTQYTDAYKIVAGLKRSGNNVTQGTYYIQVVNGSSVPSWTPYSNICPISGRSSVTIKCADGESVVHDTVTISFGETVYGGTLDVEKGELVVDRVVESQKWGDMTTGVTVLGNVTRKKFTFNNEAKYTSLDAKDDLICNIIGVYSIGYGTDSVHMYIANVGYAWVYLPVDTDNETTIQLSYTLATPRTIQLTPSQIQILKGQNTIWIEDEGATIALTYKN